MNSEFKDASKSPLKPEDLKKFDGLDFFDFDEKYKVMAQLERTPDAPWFEMKTTTERLSKERVFGIANFSIGDQEFQLNIYQGEENMNTEGLDCLEWHAFRNVSRSHPITYSWRRKPWACCRRPGSC